MVHQQGDPQLRDVGAHVPRARRGSARSTTRGAVIGPAAKNTDAASLLYYILVIKNGAYSPQSTKAEGNVTGLTTPLVSRSGGAACLHPPLRLLTFRRFMTTH